MARILSIAVFVVIGIGLSTGVLAQGIGGIDDSTPNLDTNLDVVEDSLSPGQVLSLTAMFTNPSGSQQQYDFYLGALVPGDNPLEIGIALGLLAFVTPDGSIALGSLDAPGTWAPVAAGAVLASGESLRFEFERPVTVDGQPFGQYLLFAVATPAGAVPNAQDDPITALGSLIGGDFELVSIE